LSNEPPAEIRAPHEDSAYRSGGFGPQSSVPAPAIPAPRRRFQHKLWKHLLLFGLTLVTTTVAGAGHYYSFLSDFGRQAIDMDFVDLLVPGLWYSGTLLLILGAHEMGHYSYCRRYNVDATLPYFLPFLFFTGTLGAVIRIREAFPTRTVLFDIGVAGPIAGFVVVVPALFLGLSMSTVTLDPPGSELLLMLGEPLLFQWGAQIVFGDLPAGHTINMHPMVFASWFGMLATALNLLPFGQLDGGHITYATLGRWSTPISLLTVAGAIVMTFVSTSWLFFTILMVLMLLVLGPRHPRVVYEYEPLGRGRVAVAAFALLMLIVCFTPAPVEPYELIRAPQTQQVSPGP
jgi:membrane-associated protease RseP (regulator of RpoE activity)